MTVPLQCYIDSLYRLFNDHIFTVLLLVSATGSEAACSAVRAQYSRNGVAMPDSVDAAWCEMPSSGTVSNPLLVTLTYRGRCEIPIFMVTVVTVHF